MEDLSPAGQPMRALRVLAEAIEPLNEMMVRHCARPRSSVPGDYRWGGFHGALRRLEERGYATSVGGRPARWTITDAGREYLQARAKGGGR